MSKELEQGIFSESKTFRDSLDPGFLVRLQINRCNLTASGPTQGPFEANIEILKLHLPTGKLRELESESSEYTSDVEVYVYQYSCGRPMGTPEHPVFRNTFEDPFCDGGAPILVSPILVKRSVTNYRTLYKLILQKLEEANLTWRSDRRQVDGGRVDYKPPTGPPTPTYEVAPLPEEEKEEEDKA